MNEMLKSAYTWHRKAGQRRVGRFGLVPAVLPASEALELARADVAAGRLRYPSSLGNPYNRPFAAYGERHLRWIESTARAGLRFVGFADELAGLRHEGWFADDFQDETYRGAVYQLPARHGESVYVYGYDDPNNDGAALLSFDAAGYAKPDVVAVANWADDVARRAAEEQREYSAASGARLEFDQMADDANGLRAHALALIGETRAKESALADAPMIRATLCERVRAIRAEIVKMYEQRHELANQFSSHPGWRDV